MVSSLLPCLRAEPRIRGDEFTLTHVTACATGPCPYRGPCRDRDRHTPAPLPMAPFPHSHISGKPPFFSASSTTLTTPSKTHTPLALVRGGTPPHPLPLVATCFHAPVENLPIQRTHTICISNESGVVGTKRRGPVFRSQRHPGVLRAALGGVIRRPYRGALCTTFCTAVGSTTRAHGTFRRPPPRPCAPQAVLAFPPVWRQVRPPGWATRWHLRWH